MARKAPAYQGDFVWRRNVKNRTGLFCIAATLSLQTVAFGADAVEGERFARRVCTTCHSIAAGQSPMPAAPPFATIARSKNFRTQGSGLLFKSHPIMPNFAFTNEQAEDVAAYLKTLARRRTRH
jgi:mono/diheme cytochrome c family protein